MPKPAKQRRDLLNSAALQGHFAHALQLPGGAAHSPAYRPGQLLSLAQRQDLVARPAKQLDSAEWRRVRHTCQQRTHALHECAICQEPFREGKQVLLSCSHTFHHRCLISFERFASSRRCPICRCEGYQKKTISDGRTAYIHHCATLIQAHWRGELARQRYRAWRVHHPPAHPALMRGWLEDRAQWHAREMREALCGGGQDLDALFAECDVALAGSRPVFATADAALSERLLAASNSTDLAGAPPQTQQSGRDVICSSRSSSGLGNAADAFGNTLALVGDIMWPNVLAAFQAREHSECPICMATLAYSSRRACSLLSCSHAFHSKCIAAFEGYAQACESATDKCPVCRAHYSKHSIRASANGEWRLERAPVHQDTQGRRS